LFASWGKKALLWGRREGLLFFSRTKKGSDQQNRTGTTMVQRSLKKKRIRVGRRFRFKTRKIRRGKRGDSPLAGVGR